MRVVGPRPKDRTAVVCRGTDARPRPRATLSSPYVITDLIETVHPIIDCEQVNFPHLCPSLLFFFNYNFRASKWTRIVRSLCHVIVLFSQRLVRLFLGVADCVWFWNIFVDDIVSVCRTTFFETFYKFLVICLTLCDVDVELSFLMWQKLCKM